MERKVTVRQVLGKYFMASVEGFPTACVVDLKPEKAVEDLINCWTRLFIAEPRAIVKSITISSDDVVERLRGIRVWMEKGVDSHDGEIIVDAEIWLFITERLIRLGSVEYDALTAEIVDEPREFALAWYHPVVLGFDRVWQEVSRICGLSNEEYEKERVEWEREVLFP